MKKALAYCLQVAALLAVTIGSAATIHAVRLLIFGG